MTGSRAAPPIVCAIDGSVGSRRAFREAVKLARALDTRLVAVMAWQHSTSRYDAYFPEPEGSPRVVAYATLDEVIRGEFGQDSPDWVAVRVEMGHPGKVLVDAADGAAMLVVGSRGHSGLASPFLGSVSLYCATQARCPVLVVPPVHQHGPLEEPNTQ
ncbi:universal stress protein [Leifsonia sp. 2MCAF36]|uniref:universal stress protein n=1 Tax=Leifsonia sp. 2MCAF36 TaxID=3232988 RepID=UPI003F97C94A